MPDDPIETLSEFDPNRPAVFGERLNIPYTIENMKSAFNKLAPETRNGLSAEDVVVNTHNYIKFTFQTDEQFDYVRNAGIEMYFIPMDLDVVEGGYYADEGDTDGTRVRYCVVTVAQMSIVTESKAEFEVLEELFMPEEEGYETRGFTTRSGTNLSSNFIDELVQESYLLTGNKSWLPDENDVSTATRASRPQGRIQYRDYNPGGDFRNIGMQGLKVKAIRLLKTATGICDANGYYSCDNTFNNNWKYETTFERNDFDVNNGRNGSFAYVSPKTTKSWSFTIGDRSSKGYYMSTIFRACFHYYYENINGLRRPPQNSFWKTQMKLAALPDETSNTGNTKMSRRFLGMGNAIHITLSINSNAWEIYFITIHELAHSSHWEHFRSDYKTSGNENKRVVESWAMGVGDELTRMKYPTYRGWYTSQWEYTQIVVDLIDNEADHSARRNWGKSSAQGDKISGYTIRQIEDCLGGATSFNKWKTNINNKYPNNATKQHLQELFNAWYI